MRSARLLTVTHVGPASLRLARAISRRRAPRHLRGATTMTIPLTAPGGMTVQFITGAFTWNIYCPLPASLGSAPYQRHGSSVSDQLALIGFGTVDGPGFQQTLARLAFGASGSCNEASPGAPIAEAGTETATWQGTLSARGYGG